MKKWIALLAITAFASVTQAAVLEEWDMNGNGTWQNSNNGLNLGGHYSSNNQQVAQIADDGTFIFAPTTASGFGGKTALTATNDLTAGVIKLTWTYSSVDFSTNAALNTKVGFRLYDLDETDYVALEVIDSGDKVWSFTRTVGAGLGALDQKTGRLVNGLGPDSTPRSITIELDYANSEIRTYSSTGWQWSPNGVNEVFTNSVDFAAAGFTEISHISTYYSNWSTGDQMVMDNLALESAPPAELTGVLYLWDNDGLTNNSPLSSSVSEGSLAPVNWGNSDLCVISNDVQHWEADGVASHTFAGKALNGATGGEYELSYDVVSADFANTAAIDGSAAAFYAVRGTASGNAYDAGIRIRYEGKNDVTNNVIINGVTNSTVIYPTTDQMQILVKSADLGDWTVMTNFAGSSISDLNLRGEYNLNNNTYDAYFTLGAGSETLLHSGALQIDYELNTIRIGVQAINGDNSWQQGDVLELDNIVITETVAPYVASAAVVTVDEWDMNGNGTWQSSDNGINLGGHYSSNNQQVAQIADDGTFIFSPTTAGGFGPKSALNEVIDITEDLVTLSWTYSSMNWTSTPTANNQVGFRLWNDAGTEYVGLAFADNSDKIWAYQKSSSGLGNLNIKTGRVINSLSETGTPRTVVLEIDYANSEIRMSADSWQWNNGFNVHTTVVDFASAGVTDISKFQTYYQNWGTGDETVFDNLKIERGSEPAVEYYGDTVVQEWNFTGGSMVSEQGTNATWLNSSGNIDVAGDNALTVNRGNGFSGKVPLGQDITSANSSNLTVAFTISEFDFSNSTNQDFALRLWGDGAGTKVIDLRMDANAAASKTKLGTGATDLVPQSLAGNVIDGVESFGAPITVGVTLDFSGGTNGNGGYTYWVGHPDTDDGSAWQYRGPTYTGTVDLVGISIDSFQWYIANHADGDSLTLDRVIISRDAIAAPTDPTGFYNAWAAGFAGFTQTGLTDDQDGDLLDNLGEYAFGGDPTAIGDQGNTPVHAQTTDGGTNYFEYVYFERDDAAARGLSSILEVGTDLVYTNWTTAGIEFVGSGASAVPGYNAVTNRISTDDDAARFLNLRIQFTP